MNKYIFPVDPLIEKEVRETINAAISNNLANANAIPLDTHEISEYSNMVSAGSYYYQLQKLTQRVAALEAQMAAIRPYLNVLQLLEPNKTNES